MKKSALAVSEVRLTRPNGWTTAGTAERLAMLCSTVTM